jgi:hypothetical protein
VLAAAPVGIGSSSEVREVVVMVVGCWSWGRGKYGEEPRCAAVNGVVFRRFARTGAESFLSEPVFCGIERLRRGGGWAGVTPIGEDAAEERCKARDGALGGAWLLGRGVAVVAGCERKAPVRDELISGLGREELLL